MSTPEEGYFVTMLTALDEARVPDFVRYVNKRAHDEPSLAGGIFFDSWNVMLGGYATQVANAAKAT